MLKIFRLYWVSMRKNKWMFALMCGSMMGTILIGALRPLYLREIVDVFTAPERNGALARQLFWEVVAVATCVFLMYRLSQHAMANFEARTMKDLDERSFAILQRQSIRFFEDAFAGSLMKSATKFRGSFEGITDIMLQDVGRSTLMIIVVFVIILYSMPNFAIFFGAWIIAFFVFTWKFVNYKYPLDTANANADSAIGGTFIDSLGNQLTVKAFGCEKLEQKRFDAVVLNSYEKRMKSWLVGNTGGAIQGMLVVIAELGLIFWSITRWEKGMLTVGEFVFLQAYVIWILGELRSVGNSIRKLFGFIADAQEMADIYCLEPEIKDIPHACPLVVSEGGIDFHGLSFRYGEDSSKPFALDNVSIKVPPGQSVGIVGMTGAGKTTLIKLLMRLYPLDSGYIRIDGQDITSVTQESLRQQIGFVPQQPQLFHRSIRDNIAFARSDATDDEIIHAAELAHAWRFIKKLSEGLHTMVGERGVKLSGGECQRIAIARAILANPEILILDEATSALDSATEKEVQAAIAELLPGRTSLVIAHRLSTLMQLDRIIVLDNGRIIEDGTHNELLNLGGLYADLWEHQSGGYLPKE